MKKFEIGQIVCSAIIEESEPVIIQDEYYNDYLDLWYFGVTYKNEFRYVPQDFLKLFGNKVLCRERNPEKQGKYYTNIGYFYFSGKVLIPNESINPTDIIEHSGFWGNQTNLSCINTCFPIWWIEEVNN